MQNLNIFEEIPTTSDYADYGKNQNKIFERELFNELLKK